MLKKEIIPTADPQKESLVGVLLEKLSNRFCGEILDELGNLSKKFTRFLITW